MTQKQQSDPEFNKAFNSHKKDSVVKTAEI